MKVRAVRIDESEGWRPSEVMQIPKNPSDFGVRVPWMNRDRPAPELRAQFGLKAACICGQFKKMNSGKRRVGRQGNLCRPDDELAGLSVSILRGPRKEVQIDALFGSLGRRGEGMQVSLQNL